MSSFTMKDILEYILEVDKQPALGYKTRKNIVEIRSVFAYFLGHGFFVTSNLF